MNPLSRAFVAGKQLHCLLLEGRVFVSLGFVSHHIAESGPSGPNGLRAGHLFTSMNLSVHLSKMDIYLVALQILGKTIRDQECCAHHMLVDSKFTSNVSSHPVSPM